MYRLDIWTQWDRQEHNRRMAKLRAIQDTNYIKLNNLYLQMERGAEPVNIHTVNKLNRYAYRAYDYGDPMLDYWRSEFHKLPGYLEV